MGLAASQARFLCITARKADCEYKSTELAQQKLEITNQLSDISNEYSNAMNATKLVWDNDAVDNVYGLTYGLLMTPSALNDYNPYMVTSASGAIILNGEYARAAQAAGISKAGGTGSQASRDKFIQALVPGGIVTQETADNITVNDYRATLNTAENKIEIAEGVSAGAGVSWNPSAGMGADPLNKSVVDAMDLSGLANSESIGQQLIDWGQMVISGSQITSVEYQRNLDNLNGLVKDVNAKKITNEVIAQLEKDKNAYTSQFAEDHTYTTEEQNTIDYYDNMIDNAKSIVAGNVDTAGNLLDNSGAPTGVTLNTALSEILNQLKTDVDNYKTTYSGTNVSAGNNDGGLINTSANSLNATGKVTNNGVETTVNHQITVVENGNINHYKSEINEMTIGDILTSNIVLVSSAGTNKEDFRDKVEKLFDSIVEVLGYSPTADLSGTGLNIDDASQQALEFAYKMMKTQVFSGNFECTSGSRDSEKSMTENSAYQNAVKYNGFVTMDGDKYSAVSLSNLLSMFLTYYDNGLNGINSDYVVGKTTDTSVYVTDNTGYMYLAQDDPDHVDSIVDKSADFFDQLYNNICEHGWREDAMIDDYEYLESAIKDGRYSLSSLNEDGYYYQTRYNETGYLIEESDTDAIARAEAEFTSKKAELTYKEDAIDLKTKQLDAEISSLSTEYDTVKTLISNSISKTFSLFQN